jgi:polyferredoxin
MIKEKDERDPEGARPPKKWMEIEPIRIAGQFIFVLLLNFTVAGSIYISPFLPILRLDIPFRNEYPGIYEHGQIRACPLSATQRILTDTWELSLLIFAISMVLIVALVVGRALCGWACPFGLFQDLITRFRSILRIPPREFRQRTHDKLTLLRFAILAFFLLMALAIGVSSAGDAIAGSVLKSYLPAGTCQTAPYCATCPTPSFFYVFRIASFQLSPDLTDPLQIIMWSMVGIFLIGSFLQPRFFCRYICPTGAISSPFNRISLIQLKKDQSKCTKCHVCYTNCPMRIREVLDEDRKERLVSSDCIFCGECVQRCPDKALTFQFMNLPIYEGGSSWYDRASKKLERRK